MFEIILFAGLSWAVVTIAIDCLRKERASDLDSSERKRWRASKYIASVASLLLLILAWWSFIHWLLLGSGL